MDSHLTIYSHHYPLSLWRLSYTCAMDMLLLERRPFNGMVALRRNINGPFYYYFLPEVHVNPQDLEKWDNILLGLLVFDDVVLSAKCAMDSKCVVALDGSR